MIRFETFRFTYDVLFFLIVSSILYDACVTRVQTNSKRFKVMQDSGEEETFEQRLYDIQIAEAESKYDGLVNEIKRDSVTHKLELPEYGSGVLVSRNVQRIHERDVSNTIRSVT
ncbi:hypothetical protein ACJMK2_004247 [Sinanodonta woodiana]|uniref:Uncharacterized protein n=1 Tax=Sinanodonta woodiana TaxID=1069815 RepID=A0ABD3Y2D4_SINWO